MCCLRQKKTRPPANVSRQLYVVIQQLFDSDIRIPEVRYRSGPAWELPAEKAQLTLARIRKAPAGIDRRPRASERVLDWRAFDELQRLLRLLDERIRKVEQSYNPRGC